MPRIPLRIINHLLLGAIVLVNGFIVISPLLPQLQFWVVSNTSKPQKKLAEIVSSPPSAPTSSKPSDPNAGSNHLVIPSMLLNEKVHDGRTESTLSKGIWRKPNGSTPDQGGNTILVAHRFTYTNPRATFYFLDKVPVGEKIAVFWNGIRYIYTVTDTKVVNASEVSIENPTETPQLTLYTCTPLWNPKDRLVVIAKQEGV